MHDDSSPKPGPSGTPDTEALRRRWTRLLGESDWADRDPGETYRREPDAVRERDDESAAANATAPLPELHLTLAPGFDPPPDSGAEPDVCAETIVEATHATADRPDRPGSHPSVEPREAPHHDEVAAQETVALDPDAAGRAAPGDETVELGDAPSRDPAADPAVASAATIELAHVDSRPPSAGGHRPPSSDEVSRAVGFDLLEEIGRGGMGVVYRAKQRSLQRVVAVKRIKGEAASPGMRTKFVAESLATGALEHPNIVPVYELGESPGGEVMLAMKLVGGRSWKDLLHPPPGSEPPPELAGLSSADQKVRHVRTLVQVCNAVAFAHSRGIVHNDLKPENVMLGEFGEVLVMDWGLACLFGDGETPDELAIIPHADEIRDPLGTPNYMPPELAEGDGDEIGPWTDVYLLGAIAYEIATGQPPHRANGLLETLRHAVKSEPPEFRDTEVPTEIRAICRKAMARRPEDRFQSIAELQEALRDFLRHRESREVSRAAARTLSVALERARRGETAGDLDGDGIPESAEVHRNCLYALFADAIAGFRQARLLWDGNAQAIEGERRARIVYAETALRNDDLGLAEAQLVVEQNPTAEADATCEDGGALPAGERLAPALRNDDADLVALRARIAAATADRERAARNGRLLRWSLIAATILIVVGLIVGFGAVRAERDRTRLAFAESLIAQGDALGLAERWHEARARFGEARAVLDELGRPPHAAELGYWTSYRESPPPVLELGGGTERATVALVAFLDDGRRALSVSIDGAILIHDVVTGRVETTISSAGASAIGHATLSADRRSIATTDADGRVTVRDFATGRTTASFRIADGERSGVLPVAFFPGAERLLVGGRDGHARIVTLPDGAIVEPASPMRAVPHEGAITAVAVTEAGDRWFTAGADGEIRLWETESDQLLQSIVSDGATFLASINDLAVSADGERLVSASSDRSLGVWDARTGMPSLTLRGHRNQVVRMAIAPDGRRVVSGSWDGDVRVWDLATGETARVLADPGGGWITAVAFSGDRRHVLSGGRDGRVHLWDIDEELEVAEIGGASLAVPFTALAVSIDGRVAVAGSNDGDLRLVDVASGRSLGDLPGYEDRASVTGAAITADLATVVTVDYDGDVVIWDLATGEVRRELRATVEAANSLSLAPDGRTVAVGADGLVVILDLETGEERRRLTGLAGIVTGLEHSPDGRSIATGDAAAVTLFDASAGRRRWRFEAGDPVHALAFSTDGEMLAAGGFRTSTLRLLDATDGTVLHEVDGASEWVMDAAFIEAGRLLVSGGGDQTLDLADAEVGKRLRALEEHGSFVQRVAAAPGTDVVVSAGADGRLIRWDFARPGRHERLGAAAAEAAARLATDPDDAAAKATLGRWHLFRGQFAWAAELLDAARAGGAPVGAIPLVQARLGMGDEEGARVEIERAQAASEAPAAYLERLLRSLED